MATFNISQDKLVFSASRDISSIRCIDCDILIGEVEIVPSQTEQLTMEVYFDNPTHYSRFKVGADVCNDCLRIYLKKESLFFSFLPLSRVFIRICIPQSYAGRIKFNGTSGSVFMQGISAEEICMNMVSGNSVYENCTSTLFSCDSVSGSQTLRNICCDRFLSDIKSGTIQAENISRKSMEQPGQAKIKSVSGKTNVQLLDGFDEVTVNAISGNITVTLPSDWQYNVQSGTVSGKVNTTVIHTPPMLHPTATVGTLKLSTVSGNVLIQH